MEKGDYSLQEACRVAGVSRGTLRRWLETRRLKFYRTPGGHIRIPREALDAVRGNDQGSGPRDAPSSVLRNRRERVEELALEAQELRAQGDLAKLRTEQAEEAERRAAEARARERDRQKQLEQARAESIRQAVEDAIGRIPWGLSFAEREAIADEIRAQAEALLQGASVAEVKAAIQPILDRAGSNCVIKQVLPQIRPYLRELARGDWIDDRDVDFWKRRLEPRIQAKLEEEGQKRKLTEEEAVALLHSFVDAELGL